MSEQIEKLTDSCTRILERLATIEATLAAWTVNIDRFHGQTMPRLERQLEHMDQRIDQVEQDLSGLRGRVAIIGAAVGAAAAAALSWIKHLLGAS